MRRCINDMHLSDITIGYGMTETATAATVSTLENHKFGTVGRAPPGVELRIADDGSLRAQSDFHSPVGPGFWTES